MYLVPTHRKYIHILPIPQTPFVPTAVRCALWNNIAISLNYSDVRYLSI